MFSAILSRAIFHTQHVKRWEWREMRILLHCAGTALSSPAGDVRAETPCLRMQVERKTWEVEKQKYKLENQQLMERLEATNRLVVKVRKHRHLDMHASLLNSEVAAESARVEPVTVDTFPSPCCVFVGQKREDGGCARPEEVAST